MLQLISFSKKKDSPFQPGVFSKCAAAIESCVLLEQLQSANKMVENNIKNLTEAQYTTLKNRIARHPCVVSIELLPTIYESSIFMSRVTLLSLLALIFSFWAAIIWWLL